MVNSGLGAPAVWRRLTPLWGVALYTVAGLGWISVADEVAGRLTASTLAHERLHVLLSGGFVLATALPIYLAVRSVFASVQLSERLLRSTVQSLADPVLLLDLHGHVIDANRAAAEMFGVADPSLLFMEIHQLGEQFHLRYLDGKSVPTEKYASDAALRGEVILRYEAILRRSDGTDLFITVSSAPVQEHLGAPVRMAVTVLHDIDELKRLEKLRDDFLSLTAHELKTPVATVKGYTQLMQHLSFPPEETSRALDVINKQCDRMDRMVKELLELSRVKGGRVSLHTARHDVAGLVAEAVRRMQILTQVHQLLMETAASVEATIDRDRIDQVVTNLLDNAMKFSPQGGEIRVKVEAQDSEVIVSVADRGVGIPKDRQCRIFERFYQAHVGELSNPGGLGVGLHLAREILALHGGRIWFESVPGAGTTFFLALPRADAASAAVRTLAS